MQFSAHPNTMNWGTYIKSLGLASHSISVDVKEATLLHAPKEIKKRIVALHDAGIALAVEDVGAGNLTVAHLKKFAVDIVKIDRSLVRETSVDQKSQVATEDIIAQAHKLGWKVIAGGVEKIDQLDWLQEAECDFAQGYLFAAPVPAEEFEKLLHQAG